MAQVDREYSHKESLIQQAKAEWMKKNPSPESKTEGEGGEFITSVLGFRGREKALREGAKSLEV